MKELVTMSDYGRVEVCLRPVLERAGLTRGTLARITGTRFEVVDRWYQGNVDRVDLDVLARICAVLDCQVSDLLVYTPESKDA